MMLQEVGFTPLFNGSLVTNAVIRDVLPAPTGFAEGERLTTTPAKRVSVTEADLVLSATDVAVMVTVTWLGGAVVGAAYVVAVPLGLVVGEMVPHGAVAQLTAQLTPMFAESFIT